MLINQNGQDWWRVCWQLRLRLEPGLGAGVGGDWASNVGRGLGFCEGG